MTDRNEPTDRDEIEKLAKGLYGLFWSISGEELESDWEIIEEHHGAGFMHLAVEVDANFVPRTEHEELKQRYERLLARYAEIT